ncbi:unnamed protein product [Pleuronectes platessa]|uniref:Uncharacterized protein n=1 Tax=Pleuronectes platessa TaxID=8262 RepID=A0A9N7VYY9_PLEPL|nr:unnamed protein product [Pleuronectes platessa]
MTSTEEGGELSTPNIHSTEQMKTENVETEMMAGVGRSMGAQVPVITSPLVTPHTPLLRLTCFECPAPLTPGEPGCESPSFPAQPRSGSSGSSGSLSWSSSSILPHC